jgi:polyferredoxin
MLRKIRIFAATFCFVLITLLFLDFTGTIHAWFGWLAKIQFWPALLALNVGVVVGLIILTLLLGRVYCSVICPLGVLQDIISWFASKRKKYRFSYSPALKWVRYGTLVIFILACIAGIGSLVALISPYSAYGRIASNLFAPIYQEGNNLLAYFAEREDRGRASIRADVESRHGTAQQTRRQQGRHHQKAFANPAIHRTNF